ncbi:carbohydrate ABC transporter permease [Virgibacillus sp. SK37]|uniref:carbohydrate ABC transporter permease n=1 Tax=Virgibacillus sp. SK37 TaxID=403957 RepID=UPI0004D184BD|nr:sugar ABC transporter permease [Virgibacillus sp. SK37]AIF44581.1 sugar ABC transporter permease [Virgibacillus sp. SK37]
MYNKQRERVFMLMILPAFIGFMILFIAPTAMSFFYSLTNWSVYNSTLEFVGLENFKLLFQDKKTVAAITNTIKYALLITIFQNVIAILLAVFLNKKTAGMNFVKSLVFLPAVLSILVVGFLFQYIMTSADYGLLNNIIQFFGGEPVNWLGNPKIALYSVLATQVWQWAGWSMVIYIANLKSIDSSLYEAADIDGAGPIRKFFSVTLPLLYPAVSFNILMSLIGGMKVFDVIFAMTKGGPGYATETIMTTMIREGFNSGRNAYASALAVVFFIAVFILSRIVITFLNRWERKIS